MIANDYPFENEDDKAIDELLCEFRISRAWDKMRKRLEAFHKSNFLFFVTNQNQR